jgi:hypothetical protein
MDSYRLWYAQVCRCLEWQCEGRASNPAANVGTQKRRKCSQLWRQFAWELENHPGCDALQSGFIVPQDPAASTFSYLSPNYTGSHPRYHSENLESHYKEIFSDPSTVYQLVLVWVSHPTVCNFVVFGAQSWLFIFLTYTCRGYECVELYVDSSIRLRGTGPN